MPLGQTGVRAKGGGSSVSNFTKFLEAFRVGSPPLPPRPFSPAGETFVGAALAQDQSLPPPGEQRVFCPGIPENTKSFPRVSPCVCSSRARGRLRDPGSGVESGRPGSMPGTHNPPPCSLFFKSHLQKLLSEGPAGPSKPALLSSSALKLRAQAPIQSVSMTPRQDSGECWGLGQAPLLGSPPTLPTNPSWVPPPLRPGPLQPAWTPQDQWTYPCQLSREGKKRGVRSGA